MPLVVAKLSKGLAGIFKDQLDSGALVASKIAQEYDDYCKKGMAGAAFPLLTGSEKGLMEGTLAAALSSSNGTAAMVAQAFAMAIQTYWMAPPVLFAGGPVSGVVTVMPGAMSAVGPITAALMNLNNTEDTAANMIATALDVATKTVLVTFSTPPPPTGPPPPATVV